jgi:hypothetical protein
VIIGLLEEVESTHLHKLKIPATFSILSRMELSLKELIEMTLMHIRQSWNEVTNRITNGINSKGSVYAIS